MVQHADIDHTGLTGVGGAPDAHAASHEAGGSDEIDATGLVGVGGGGGDLTELSHTVLGSAAADITVTGISGAHKDLIVVCRFRSTDAGVGLGLSMRFGAGSIDTGNNYGYHQNFVGWTSGANTGTAASLVNVSVCPNSGATAGAFGYLRLEILNYADAAKMKGFVGQAFSQDGSGVIRSEVGGLWRNAAAALDQLRMFPSAGNLATGSAVTIYGRG